MSNLNLTGIPDLEREIYKLRKHIAYLEEQLRWRPVSDELPKDLEPVEIKFKGTNSVEIAKLTEYINPEILVWELYDVSTISLYSIMGWRPIPELEVKDERG